MKTIKVVPGKDLKTLFERGATHAEIAEQVRIEAQNSGLVGEVALLIDVPDYVSDPHTSQFIPV